MWGLVFVPPVGARLPDVRGGKAHPGLVVVGDFSAEWVGVVVAGGGDVGFAVGSAEGCQVPGLEAGFTGEGRCDEVAATGFFRSGVKDFLQLTVGEGCVVLVGSLGFL